MCTCFNLFDTGPLCLRKMLGSLVLDAIEALVKKDLLRLRYLRLFQTAFERCKTPAFPTLFWAELGEKYPKWGVTSDWARPWKGTCSPCLQDCFCLHQISYTKAQESQGAPFGLREGSQAQRSEFVASYLRKSLPTSSSLTTRVLYCANTFFIPESPIWWCSELWIQYLVRGLLHWSTEGRNFPFLILLSAL